VELRVKKALLFDLSDVLIEGLHSIVKPLAEKLDILVFHIRQARLKT